jgi:flagellar operon protein
MSVATPTGIAGLNSTQPFEALKKGTQVPSAEEFRRALDQITSVPGASPGINGVKDFSVKTSEALKFSNHSIERMRSRGISFTPEEMSNIENAVTKAAAKGSKDTLVLSGDNALIVSVKNKTVVTVMDRAAMKDNVFTNIDSTIVI